MDPSHWQCGTKSLGSRASAACQGEPNYYPGGASQPHAPTQVPSPQERLFSTLPGQFPWRGPATSKSSPCLPTAQQTIHPTPAFTSQVVSRRGDGPTLLIQLP